MEEKKVYSKVCVYCKKEYESTSRGQRYCSQECCEKANERNKKVKKKRAKANKERKANEVENRLLTRAYSLCSFVVETFNIPPCNCEYCKGEVEKSNPENHHWDMNVFNNDPGNIVRLCNKKHKIIHNHLPDVNLVKVMAEAKNSDSMVEEFNILLNEIWVDFLKDKEYKTKEEYLCWLRKEFNI